MVICCEVVQVVPNSIRSESCISKYDLTGSVDPSASLLLWVSQSGRTRFLAKMSFSDVSFPFS